ncbi:MAG: NAD(P)H-binding protein [Archangium sp.]
MKFLITGATGNIGSLVTERLIARGERPSLFVRDEKKARKQFGKRVELRVGDLSDAESLKAALVDVDTLFLLNTGTELGERDELAARVVKSSSVRRVVKLSTLDVETKVGTGPWHARGEAALRRCGAKFTFLRTAAFMSNALGWAPAIQHSGVLRSSAGDGRIAFIHPHDIADVAVHALVTREHDDETLVITGPAALSYGEMAETIGRAIGKSVRFESISDAQARKMASAWAESPEYAEALVDIWRAIREGKLTTTTGEVERVLGRKPLSFAHWVSENISEFQ